MYTTTTSRVHIFCSLPTHFFPKHLRMYHLIQMMMMVMMKTILLYYTSYFQVIYKLSEFFMIISRVWYPFFK